MDKEKIQKRIEELKEETENDVVWTRKKVMANINYILSKNKQSINQKEKIYQEMIDDKYQELMEWVNINYVQNIDLKRRRKKHKKNNKRNKRIRITKIKSR